MGTEKRERQKANKALRQQQLEQADRRKRGLRIGLIVVGAIVAIFLLVWVVGQFSDDGDSASQSAPPITDEVVDEAAAGDEGSDADAGEAATDATATDADEAAADTTATETSADTDTTDEPTTEPASTVKCPAEDGTSEQVREFDGPPPMCIDTDAMYEAVIETNKGEFTIALDPSEAPETVNNFVVLSRYHYFDDTVCHRIIPDFVVQCGDPTGTGTGGPGYTFPDELPEAGDYQLGSVAMANSGPDTNGSQFFVVTGENGAALPPLYSLFGEVTDGFDTTVLDTEAAGSESGTPTEEVQIISVTVTEL